MTEIDQALLTVEAKITKIKQLLPEHEHGGRFFLPDNTFYVAPVDNSGLKSIATTICVWIGFKPVGIRFRFTATKHESWFETTETGPTIFINRRFSRNAYACAALLAKHLIQYYLEFRKHLVLKDSKEQQELISLGVVHSGLGIVGLNYTHSPFWQEQYPKLYYLAHKSHAHSKLTQQYAHFTQNYASENGLAIKPIMKYLCPWAWPYFSNTDRVYVKAAGYVENETKKAKNAYIGLVGSVLFVAFGAILSGYVFSQRPRFLPAGLQNEKEEIEILRNSYELCTGSITKKEANYKNEDIFIERSLEADHTRCTSLRNLYNYRVEQYNKQLKSL